MIISHDISRCPSCAVLIACPRLLSQLVLAIWSDQGQTPNVPTSAIRCPRCALAHRTSQLPSLGTVEHPVEEWTIHIEVGTGQRILLMKLLRSEFGLSLTEAREQVDTGPRIEGHPYELRPTLAALTEAGLAWRISHRTRLTEGSPEAWLHAPHARWIEEPDQLLDLVEGTALESAQELDLRVEAFQQANLPWREDDTPWVRPAERDERQALNVQALFRLLERCGETTRTLLFRAELHRSHGQFRLAEACLARVRPTGQDERSGVEALTALVAARDERLRLLDSV